MNRARAFLDAYRICGKVKAAAEASGVKRRQHYTRLRTDERYQREFREAHEDYLLRIREEAEERAEKFHDLEIGQLDQRIKALQTRWDMLRRGLVQIIEERGADMHDVPGGKSGLLCRDFKGKDANQEISKIDPGIAGLLGELRAHEKFAAEQLGQLVEKREVTGPGGGAVSIEVSFVKPAQQPPAV